MYISITAIKLKHFLKIFTLAFYGMQVSMQVKKEKGFKKFKKTGFGNLHFTLTAWENEDDMKRFVRSGAHLAAMKETSKIADEVYSYTYKSDNIPDWKEAKKLLFANGKTIKFGEKVVA